MPEERRDALLLELGHELVRDGRVSDDLRERLRQRFDDAELARLLEVGGWATQCALPNGDRQAGPPPDRERVSRRAAKPLTVATIATLGTFMAWLDDTVVGIAFPDLLGSFPSAGLGSLSWVINSYNIVFAAFLVPAGRLADLLGRRRVFMLGIALFTLFSAACAVAPSVETLIAARALQALGAAIVVPASLGLVIAAYPPGQQAGGIAIWGASAALAGGLGPTIGGVLVEVESWRLVFLVNLPVGLLAYWLAKTQLVESRAPGRRAAPDAKGALLLMLAVALLAFGMVQSEDWGWTSAGVIGSLAVAAVAAFAFVRRSMWHGAPALDLKLLSERVPAVASSLTLVGAVGYFALSLSLVIWLMTVWGYTPFEAGLAMTPGPFVGVLGSWLAGLWPSDRDLRPLLVIGGVIWSAGALMLVTRVGTEPDFLREWLPAMCVLNFGIGICFPTASALGAAGASGERFATATGLNSMIRMLGAAIGIALFVTLVGQPARAEAAAAYDRMWTVAAALFAAVTLGSLALGRVVHAVASHSASDSRPAAARFRSSGTRARLGPAARPQLASGDQTLEELLAAVPALAGLGAGARAAILASATPTSVLAGSWLFRQGDPADALYVVLAGRLEVVLEPPGEEPERIGDLRRGALVGELTLISRSPRSDSVRACRDSELLRLGRADFERLLAEERSVRKHLLGSLARQLEQSRPARPVTGRAPATVAIVPLEPGVLAPALGEAIAQELAKLTGVAVLDRATFSAQSDDGDPALALARLLERCEGERRSVLLVASEPPRADPWTGACLRQADRVLVVIGDDVPGAAPDHPALQGCELLVCGRPPSDQLGRLLDALDARGAQRLSFSVPAGFAAVARRLAGRSVGLVLSGGGARALAHVGVIEELQAAGVVVDRIAGAGMGAFIGALAAQGMDADEIDARCYEEWVRRSPLSDYRFPRTSLIRGERVRAMLERNLPGAIEDLARPFWCVSTDILSGELVVHRRGPLVESVGASMCLPVLGPPVVYDGRYLVYGGVLDNMPVGIMAEAAEGPIVASNAEKLDAHTPEPGAPLRPPTLAETLNRLILLGTSDTIAAGRRDATVLITPDAAGVGLLEFHMLDSLRESGRRAAAEALERAPAELFG